MGSGGELEDKMGAGGALVVKDTKMSEDEWTMNKQSVSGCVISVHPL